MNPDTKDAIIKRPKTRKEWDNEVTMYLNWWEAHYRAGAKLSDYWFGDNTEMTVSDFGEWCDKNDIARTWRQEDLHIAMIREKVFHPGIIVRAVRWTGGGTKSRFRMDDEYQFSGNEWRTELTELNLARDTIRQYFDEAVNAESMP